MSEKPFTKVMRGLEEAKAYMEGEREGCKATVPPSVGVKSIDQSVRLAVVGLAVICHAQPRFIKVSSMNPA